MKRNNHVPCAQSEPADLQDEVISALLWRAGELLEGHQRGTAFTPFQAALNHLLDVVHQNPELSRLLEILPQALGNGLIVQSVFARLFNTQPQPLANVLPAYSEKKPTLTQREREILIEIAKGRLVKEIPAHIPPTRDGTPVAEETVRRHLTHIYRKLDVVRSPKEAVAKAAALGLLKLDLCDLIQPLRDRKALSLNAFTGVLLEGIDRGQKYGEIAGQTKHITALLLLTFLSVCLMGQVRYHQVQHSRNPGKGSVFEFAPDGRFVRAFGEEILRSPHGLAFAPPAAERHRFRQGNLFVADVCCPDPLNEAVIVELTSDGRYVRAFTGGAYLSTRLSCGSVAFTWEGKLLTTSGTYMDGVIEFTQGGGSVRRFASLVPIGMTVDKRGDVYVAGGWSGESAVHIFDSQGERLRKIGLGKVKHYAYTDVAVDERGSVYVSNELNKVIEIFSASGKHVGNFGDGNLNHPYKIALSPEGKLYVTDDRNTVKVFDPHRRTFLFSFSAPQALGLRHLTFAPNSNLFATGVVA